MPLSVIGLEINNANVPLPPYLPWQAVHPNCTAHSIYPVIISSFLYYFFHIPCSIIALVCLLHPYIHNQLPVMIFLTL